MAMLITRFHRLIQNKLIWIAFLVIVVLSFVVWGTQSTSPSDYRRQFAAGELNGESISQEEFNDAKFSSYLSFLLSSGSPIPYNSRLDELIRPMAWRRLASLQLAHQLGLTAGDNEVFQSILQEPSFQTEGQFDASKYEGFLNQQMGAILQGRLSKQRFERHVREELSLNKLRIMLQQTALVPPSLSRQAYRRLNDEQNVLVAFIRREPVAETIQISEEDARAYFDAHPEDFRLPERRIVAYARIDLESVMDQVVVDEADIEAYYQENLDSYRMDATNETSGVDGEKSEEDKGEGEDVVLTVPMERYRPREEVREEISTTLRQENARVQALDLANDIVYELQPDQFGRAPSFEELADRNELAVQETEPFARSAAGLAGIPEDVVGDFVQQSFLLYDTPDEYYSNPLSGQDEVFVVALRSVIPPEVPAFEDVREAATEAAEADALAEALAEKANRVRTVLEQTFLDDADIHETLDALGIESSETGYFSVVDGLEEVSYAGPLRRVVGSLNVGETSEPIPDGPDLVLAHVMDRKPAAEEGFLPFKDSFDRTMQLRYASALLSDWQDHLLEEAGFVDRTAPEPEDPAAEE